MDQTQTPGLRHLSRTPHGVRGLKYPYLKDKAEGSRSHPTRGAWIEMTERSLKKT